MSSVTHLRATVQPAPFQVSAAEAEAITGGHWHGADQLVVLHGAAIDSRAVTPGCLFACIRGERVDGHDFAASAAGDGAVLIVATRQLALSVAIPVLVVADVALALQALATLFRACHHQARWIAVCGANGKTTTKELLAAACAGGGDLVHATLGNLNNHLGVPLTVLNTPAEAVYCVIEIGTNAPGEVAALAACVAPHVAVVTSIGPEHLEGFGDLVGVAREECSVFAALADDGAAFLGLHGLAGHTDAGGIAAIAQLARTAAHGRVLTLCDDAETSTGCAEVAVVGRTGELSVRLDTAHGSAEIGFLGVHNLANATLAFHAAVAAGVAPAAALAGLSRATPVAGRLVPRPAGIHLVLDDTYNANPASMIAGLHVLAGCPGRHLAILGPMGELGDAVAEGHRLVGATAKRLGIPLIIVAGRGGLAGCETFFVDGYGPDSIRVADREQALLVAREHLASGATTILVKGSRSQALEFVVAGLCQQGGTTC